MTYDAVVVGTGFASTFFLHRYLQRSGPGTAPRVLVLERGARVTHGDQINGGRSPMRRAARRSFVNASAEGKAWRFLLGHGGGSICWTGNTPRMLPEDFRLRSSYGVASDWPIAYEDLEPYYCDAEDLMQVSGDSADTPFPRSRPYPQPPHRFTNADRAIKAAWPEAFFHAPSARPPTASAGRAMCCANSRCGLCPIDSKFTVLNAMEAVYADPRVTVAYGARVDALNLDGGLATGVVYETDGRWRRAEGDLVVLGANALFNPHILLRSGLEHPQLGRGLVEEVSKTVRLDLAGLDNFQGSTYVTGHGYMLYGGDARAERASALIETNNRPELRLDRGKWRQHLRLRVVYEDLRQDHNRVTVDPQDPARPIAAFAGPSDYTLRAIERIESDIAEAFAALPVERIEVEEVPNDTEAHIIGTTPMGDDPATSVLDRDLLHHNLRNLYVLGSSVFPTCDPSNPTLTLSALALRAGDHAAGAA